MNDTATSADEQRWLKITYTAFHCAILVFSVLGNAFIALALIRARHVKKLVDKLVLNLAVTNLLLVIVSIPTDIITRSSKNYPFGEVGCAVIHPLSTYAINTGVFTLMAIAFERWQAVAKLFAFDTRIKVIMTIGSTHFLGSIIVLPYALTLKISVNEGSIICEESWSVAAARVYTIVLFTAQYAFPVPIMLILYIKAWIAVQKTNITTIRNSITMSKENIIEDENNENFASPLMLLCNQTLDKTVSFIITEEEEEEEGNKNASLPHNKILEIDESSIRSNPTLYSSTGVMKLSSPKLNKQCKSLTDIKLHNIDSNLYSPPTRRVRSSIASNGNIFTLDDFIPSHTQQRLRRPYSVNCDLYSQTKPRRRSLTNRMSQLSKSSLQSITTYIFPDGLIEPGTLQHIALQKRFKQSRDLLRMFTVVVMVFVVFMLPNQIYWLTMYFSDHKQNQIAKQVVYLLTYANCVLNPWIYGGLNSRFRRDFRKI